MTTCYLSAIAVQTGELLKPIEQIAEVKRQFAAVKLPFNKMLLGCDSYCQTELEPGQLVEQVMVKSLAVDNTDPASIDLLILVSANPLTLQQLNHPVLMGIAQRTGLCNARPMATTFEECTGFISAIDVARSQIIAGSATRVLIVSIDVTDSDLDRVKPFGVRSDAAFAAIVSEDGGSGAPPALQIVATAKGMDFAGYQGQDNLDTREALVKRVIGSVLTDAAIDMKAISKVFSTNFYRPIATYNASAAGIDQQQLYVATTKKYGHCVCGDPLLNLDDYDHNHDIKASQYFLLQSYAPGFLATVLLQAQ